MRLASLSRPWHLAIILSLTILNAASLLFTVSVGASTAPTALLDTQRADPLPKLAGIKRAPVTSAAKPKGLTDFVGWAKLLGPAADSAALAAVLQTVYEQDAEAGTRSVRAYDKGRSSQVAIDQMSHAVGAYAFHRYGRDPKVAWSHCLPDYENACYHTVSRQYLETLPSLTLEDMPGMCERVFETHVIACALGFGHSLLYLFGFDVEKAVQYCLALDTPTSVSGCGAGLFAQHTRQGHRGVVVDFALPDDPLYPCNVIKALLDMCYLYRSQAFLEMTAVDGQYDAHKAARMCDEVIQAWRNSCYRGLGVTLYTNPRISPTSQALDQMAPLCREFKGNGDACLAGAVISAMARRDYPSEKGREFCATVHETDERFQCDQAVADALAAETGKH